MKAQAYVGTAVMEDDGIVMMMLRKKSNQLRRPRV